MTPSTVFRLVPWAVVVVLVIYVMFLRRNTSDLNAAWRTQAALDSVVIANLQAERDSSVLVLRDSIATLANEREHRPPTRTRTVNAIRTLTGAPVDSLFNILDRPLPE